MNDVASQNPPAPRPRRVSRLGGMIGLAVGALALGLLIWAKLQLVAGVPRTAVADPPSQTSGPVAPFEGQASAPTK